MVLLHCWASSARGAIWPTGREHATKTTHPPGDCRVYRQPRADRIFRGSSPRRCSWPTARLGRPSSAPRSRGRYKCAFRTFPSRIEGIIFVLNDSHGRPGRTIAIVDAYDDPRAEADLGTFSSKFGLPPCTTANGCFKKVGQTGTTRLPRGNQGWALEISLDVQWAHAVAPGAHVLLVEANSASFTDLMAAVDYAKAHAQYVSMSWGGSEFSGESAYDFHFQQSGVSFFVSSGDNGTPAEYPSASPKVISVGGTTLHFDSSGAVTSETGWSGSAADAACTKVRTPLSPCSANTHRQVA